MTNTKVVVQLENCYGINSLDYIFDFAKTKSYVIYAPNGTMKSSFAKTFIDYSKGQPLNILPFPGITPKVSITDSKKSLSPQDIFVVKSEITDFSSDKMSTLLVNKELREKHLGIMKKIEDKENMLINELQQISGIKNSEKKPNNLELTFTKDITGSANESLFLTALGDQKTRVEQSEKEFKHIPYSTVFNDKTELIFASKDFATQLESYMSTYNQLIASSVFFQKGTFTHINADEIAEKLITNGFFKAHHKVSINTRSGIKTISTEDELKKAIDEEKSLILNNPDLRKSFETFSKKILQKNEKTSELSNYLESNPDIIEYLKDWQNFKKNVWASFLKEAETAYNEVIQANINAQPELKKIREAAIKESSKWEAAVNIFKDRFNVPFKINIDNKIDVMLKGEDTVPTLSFEYKDRFTSATLPVSRDTLYKALSTGEQRALYILNIIFEIEARKELNTKTIFIFDDIADSFDYKNKYAIIQYLYELQSYENSFQIILTHNFDFFRTVVSRLNIARDYALHPEITQDKIILNTMPYQQDLFNHWKKILDKDNKILVASIPFMRNITDYCGTEDFCKLTALLHMNPDIYPKTNDITVKDLECIIKKTLKNNDACFKLANKTNSLNDSDKIKDIIYQTADTISYSQENTYFLENKIVLSIAIRLKTEEFILNALEQNKKPIKEYCKTQTFNLIQNYLEHFKNTNKDILTKVQLMTPENIHMNAFMYEPILDTGFEHLVTLYNDVKNLK